MFHSLAVRVDGTVWAWGMNGEGQLGSGGASGAYSVAPIQVPGINDAVAVAGGWHQSYAIRSNGTLWSWGSAYTGLGSYSFLAAPTQVLGLSGVESVAAGEASSYAVRSDGTLWSWGFNGNGQLGTGSFVSAYSPVQVTALQGVVAVATHFAHAVALKSDGSVWAWGYNSNGQLGDGTFIDRRAPVQVLGLDHVVQVGASAFGSFALRDDGTVWTWGADVAGGANHMLPIRISGLNNVEAIAVGGFHLLAREMDGSLWGWGSNFFGQLGLSTQTPYESVPAQIAGVNPVALIAAGRAHSLAAMAVVPDTTPPSLTVPDAVYEDGQSPAGATVSYSVSAVDDSDPHPTVTCSPASGTLFPLLVTTVNCTATDAAGNTAQAAFDVTVKDANWQLEDVLGLLQSWNLGKLGTSLMDKLHMAQRFNAEGRLKQACDNLESLLAQVSAQTGKGLTVEQALELTTRVRRIQDVIGC
jgi:alpha-tubulin suppressor-like RCC1 family protein